MKFIEKYGEDILILGGLAVVIFTTFLLSIIAGLYLLGAVMIALGVWFAR